MARLLPPPEVYRTDKIGRVESVSEVGAGCASACSHGRDCLVVKQHGKFAYCAVPDTPAMTKWIIVQHRTDRAGVAYI
jgi:hypothetical protein